jgi:agmatine deiminase
MTQADPSPREAGFAQPGEWAPHAACWLAWPSHEELWQAALGPVQKAFVAFARAIADPGPDGVPRGERLEVLAPDPGHAAEANERLAGLGARVHEIPFGDIWMRDIAPIFLASASGEVAAASFGFNGWGGKYDLPGDTDVSMRVANASGLLTFRDDLVLEGGSVEPDGEGTLLTTRQCLLNPNRNPGLAQGALEARLRAGLGAETVLWLGDGLINDHTDGHVDTVARFVAPGVVVCMEPSGGGDPNAASMKEILRDLASMRDAKGRRLELFTVPSPGVVTDPEGELMAASYVNFYVANTTVTVPVYGSPNDGPALSRIERLFPGRRVFDVPARELLLGGGAFHCISQQQPSGGRG